MEVYIIIYLIIGAILAIPRMKAMDDQGVSFRRMASMYVVLLLTWPGYVVGELVRKCKGDDREDR